jgi:hypothetical protein
MTQVYLVSAARDVLDGVEPDERKTLTAELQSLPDVPAAEVTKVQLEGQEYEAAAVSDGWVAVFRNLQPDETPTHERAIAVMDLLPTDDAAASSAHANGPTATA